MPVELLGDLRSQPLLAEKGASPPVRSPALAELPLPPPTKAGWPWTIESPRLPDTMPDGRPWPRVSVVTPSYNQGRFIEETIRSVLLQGYPNLEYIIMDSGTTDVSVEIIRKYEPWLSFWVSGKDGGQSDAINKGWNRASGDIVAWLNSDDTYSVGTIRCAVDATNSHKSIAMVYGTGEIIDQDGKKLGYQEVPDFDVCTMLRTFDNIVPSVTAFMKRDALEHSGFLDTSFHYTMDFELFLRFGLRYPVLHDERIRSNIRLHTSAKSVCGPEAGFIEIYKTLRSLEKDTQQEKQVLCACKEGIALGCTKIAIQFSRKGVISKLYGGV